MPTKVYAEGDLLVTGTGEVIIDEVVPKSRALLVRPEDFVVVCFDPSEPPPPPCSGGLTNEVCWELFLRPHHRRHHTVHSEEDLRLKIRWSVSTARTIIWQIRVPA